MYLVSCFSGVYCFLADPGCCIVRLICDKLLGASLKTSADCNLSNAGGNGLSGPGASEEG
jgi:hypothetical protein